ncbi:MAG: hypothetical protein LBN40_02470 [Oscillospiraceae bacterium]|jgi:flagellar assembly protein FliH|nr:hypothetical protein [Oscillospiraceae bacterium]
MTKPVLKQSGGMIYMRGGTSAAPVLKQNEFTATRDIPVQSKLVSKFNPKPLAPEAEEEEAENTGKGGYGNRSVLDDTTRVGQHAYVWEDFGEKGQQADTEKGSGKVIKAPPPLPSREEVIVEYEKLKQSYINEGEYLKNEAESRARGMIEKAQAELRAMYIDAEREAVNTQIEAEKQAAEMMERSRAEGYADGYDDGNTKGYREGLGKCKAALKELAVLLDEVPKAKDEIYKEYEHDLFDLVFTICSKVTEDSLKQKDKNVIQKMLKTGAKQFRNAEFVRVSISKLDADETAEADLELLKRCFRDEQTIEIEILKDAARGTVIIEDDKGSVDMSMKTQLEMIEMLGKGKFRNTKP